jgi:phosphoglycerate dehydrogenase-like enzyme
MKAAFFTGGNPSIREDRIDSVFARGRQEIISELCELYPVRITPENFDDHAANLVDVEVIFSTWGMPKLSSGQLDRLPDLKAVFYAAGSVKSFASPLLDRGIKLSSAAAMNAIPVAEFCLAQILLSCKRYFANSTSCRNKVFSPEIVGLGNYGETVALIGAGAVARHLLTLLRPFNLRIIAVANDLTADTARDLGIAELVSIEEAFERAYVISNHLPNLPSLYKVITARHFESMRSGATFINTGRGAQVDEQGLADVFSRRSDLTAMLDVTDPEPPSPDSSLFNLPNILFSAHIAGSKNDERIRLADCVIAEFRRFAQGLPLRHEISPEMLKNGA